MPERFPFCDVADMHFHDRQSAVLYCVTERYARMRVPACVQYDTVSLKVLNPVDQVAFVVRLHIREEDLRPFPLDL